MKPIIEIKNIGKKYKIQHIAGGYVSLRDVLATIIKSPFRFMKTKAKTILGSNTKEDFWALKNVNLNIKKGEVIGIIGPNGAGKSTLLKILSQITPPTEGEIIIRGSVGSLLEVGTGFHPELSGRENIFLNAAILGMTRKDTTKKFDAIVEFAGIDKFLDTPVKYYSSGMYVRLAFSVAAHLEPDILIIDEVLAVGDAEFQKKCLGKMEDITSKEGRTILFVSHNLPAVQSLCKTCVLIEGGNIKMVGETNKVIQTYLDEFTSNKKTEWTGDEGDEQIRIMRTSATSKDLTGDFHTAAPVEITIEGEVLKPTQNLILGFRLFSEFGSELAYTLYDDEHNTMPPVVPAGPFKKTFVIPANTLAQGSYRIELDIGIHNLKKIVGGEAGGLVFTMQNILGLGRRFPVPLTQGYAGLFRPDWFKKEDSDIWK